MENLILTKRQFLKLYWSKLYTQFVIIFFKAFQKDQGMANSAHWEDGEGSHSEYGLCENDSLTDANIL